MKSLFALALFVSSSAYSAVEIYRKEMNNVCTLKGNKLTRSVAVNYGKTGAKTTQDIEVFGVEELAKKAHSLSTGRTIMEGYEMKVIVDGDEANLHFQDSKEASSLITLMSKICD